MRQRDKRESARCQHVSAGERTHLSRAACEAETRSESCSSFPLRRARASRLRFKSASLLRGEEGRGRVSGCRSASKEREKVSTAEAAGRGGGR